MEQKKLYALLVACLLSVIGLPFSVVDFGWIWAVIMMVIEIPVIYFLYLKFGYSVQDKMYGKHADKDERLRYCHMYSASVSLMVLVSVLTLYIYFYQFWVIDIGSLALASGSILFALLVFGITFVIKSRWG